VKDNERSDGRTDASASLPRGPNVENKKTKKTNEAKGANKKTEGDVKPSAIRRLIESFNSAEPVAKYTLIFTAIAAIAGVVYTISFIRLSKWQVEVTQRPRIIITKFGEPHSWDISHRRPDVIPLTQGKPIAVVIEFTNNGHSSAVNEVTHRHILFGDDTHKLHIEGPDKIGSATTSTVEPGTPLSTNVFAVRDTFSQESNDVGGESNLLNWDGNFPIIVFGRFYYEDTAGNSYCLPYMSKRDYEGGYWEQVATWKDYTVTPSIQRRTTDLCPAGEP
jgi:hypothetical protein